MWARAAGKLDQYTTDNSADGHTFWRHSLKKFIPFAFDSLEQPFSTNLNYGGQAQVQLNRQGDLLWHLYVHVKLPGIAACDGTATGECAQIAVGNRFPVNDCAGSVTSDDAFFASKVPGIDAMTAEERKAALKEARDTWRRSNYGSARELGCCVDEEDGCPTDMCEELDGLWCHYVNDVGHALIEQAVFKIGGTTIDTITGLQMFCWEELCGKSGRRLQEMTGRRYTLGQLFCDSRESRDLYIPLPFFFTHHSQAALPAISMMYNQMTLEINFAALEKIIVVSSDKVSVRNAMTNTPLQRQDLQASVEATYVLVETVEDEYFENNKIEQVIMTHQSLSTTLCGASARIPLTFTQAVGQMMFVVRMMDNLDKNDWTNLAGIDRRDPIKSVELKCNSTSYLTGKKPPVYFRSVVPYMFHSNIPETFIYVISFAVSPEDTLNPSGHLNFSKIDNIELHVELQDALRQANVEITVMARSWNVLAFESGTAQLKFV